MEIMEIFHAEEPKINPDARWKIFATTGICSISWPHQNGPTQRKEAARNEQLHIIRPTRLAMPDLRESVFAVNANVLVLQHRRENEQYDRDLSRRMGTY